MALALLLLLSLETAAPAASVLVTAEALVESIVDSVRVEVGVVSGMGLVEGFLWNLGVDDLCL